MSDQRIVRVTAVELKALRAVLERVQDVGQDSKVRPHRIVCAVLDRGEIGLMLGRSWEVEGGW
jgi:hypothetical protein